MVFVCGCYICCYWSRCYYELLSAVVVLVYLSSVFFRVWFFVIFLFCDWHTRKHRSTGNRNEHPQADPACNTAVTARQGGTMYSIVCIAVSVRYRYLYIYSSRRRTGRSSIDHLDHLDPNVPFWCAVQDLCNTDPTQETCPWSYKVYDSHR